MDQLLKFDGRIRRKGFWMVSLGASVVSTLASLFAQGDTNIILLLIVLVIALAAWLVSLAVSVRRWHDHNKSGWWVLIGLVPLIGTIYSLVKLGFMDGDQGPNNYGPAPLEGELL